MKRRIVLLAILPVLAFWSCTSDDDRPIKETSITSKIIDEKGGIIDGEEIKITFPENTFSGSHDIEVYYTNNEAFGTNQVSKNYLIKNIPLTFNKPISVEIEVTAPANETLGAAVEETVFIKSLNKEENAYRIQPCERTGNSVIITIPATNEQLKSEQNISFVQAEIEYIDLGLTAIAGFAEQVTTQGHFKIFYPKTSVNEIDELAGYLEEAYTKFSSPPFGFSYAARTKWPVEVTVKKLKESVFGYMAPSAWGDNYASLEINSDKLKSKEELRVTVGHEFFHFVQNLYDKRNRFSKAKLESPQLWLDEASSVWVEEKFSNVTNYISSVRSGNEKAPLNGMVAGVETDVQNHGYGMSAMIKYLAEKYGEGILLKVYEEISKDNSPANALKKGIPEMIMVWYPQFLEQYVTGKLYSDINPAFLTGNKAGEFNASKSSDTVKIFNVSYPDLSGRIYQVTLSPTLVSENSTLSCSASPGENDLYIIKYNTSKLETLASGNNNANSGKIKEWVDYGYKFFVLAVNSAGNYPYSSTNEPELIIRIKNEIRPVNLSFSIPSLSVNGVFRHFNSDDEFITENGTYNTDDFKSPHDNQYSVPCEYQEGVFTGSWDKTYEKKTEYYNLNNKGNIEFELDANYSLSNVKITMDLLYSMIYVPGEVLYHFEIVFNAKKVNPDPENNYPSLKKYFLSVCDDTQHLIWKKIDTQRSIDQTFEGSEPACDSEYDREKNTLEFTLYF
ncbi:MAG TPA: hypothetical protein PLK12_06815 [Prolixibacteraceae bacterium]|nr:hypothetical protein [Prolixibacteraceae bacterium]